MSYSTVDAFEQYYPAGQLTSPINNVMRGGTETSYVTKIEQWHNGDCIRGVQVTWSDGTIQSAGSQVGFNWFHNFTEPFLIYKVRLASCNFRSGRFTGIKFWTTKDVKGEPDFSWGDFGDSHEFFEFSHGVQFIGFDISAGADIDKLVLIVSPQLTSYEYVEVNFDTSNQNQFNKPDQLEKILAINGDSINQAIVLSSTRAVTTSKTVTDSHGGKFGVATKFGKKDVVDITISGEATWGEATANTTTTVKTMTANLNIVVSAYSKITATAVASMTTTKLPFSAILVARYEGGREKRFPVTGVYTDVDCASYVMEIGEHVALTDAEKAIHSGVSQHNIN